MTPNKFYGEDMLAGAVFNQGPNDLVAEAARSRTSNFTVKSRFNWDAGAHQITYLTPRYAVFTNVFTSPCKSFSQTYPTGVRWVAPQTGPISMLWLTVPCYDAEQRERQVSRPHGVHGSGQSTMLNNGTLLYVCDTTGGNVNIKHALCFVPSGALAVVRLVGWDLRLGECEARRAHEAELRVHLAEPVLRGGLVPHAVDELLRVEGIRPVDYDVVRGRQVLVEACGHENRRTFWEQQNL